MFTNRFILAPISVYDKKHKELTGKETSEMSYIKFNPFEIASYRPSYAEDDTEERNECTSVVLKSGDTTLIYLTVKEFENLLNSHNQ